MSPIEQFRASVSTALQAATAAGADPSALARSLVEMAGIDPQRCGAAADDLDGLIDGREEDELGSNLVEARDILRNLATR